MGLLLFFLLLHRIGATLGSNVETLNLLWDLWSATVKAQPGWAKAYNAGEC